MESKFKFQKPVYPPKSTYLPKYMYPEDITINSDDFVPITTGKYYEILKFIMSKKKLLQFKNSDDDTVLHMILNNGELTETEKKDIIIKMVNLWSAPVDNKNKDGIRPIHLAKNLELVKFLISKKVNINSRDNNGFTPLHYAVMPEGKKCKSSTNNMLKNMKVTDTILSNVSTEVLNILKTTFKTYFDDILNIFKNDLVKIDDIEKDYSKILEGDDSLTAYKKNKYDSYKKILKQSRDEINFKDDAIYDYVKDCNKQIDTLKDKFGKININITDNLSSYIEKSIRVIKQIDDYVKFISETNIYDVNKIHIYLQKYYHIDKTNDLIIESIEPFFENIGEYDIIKPIEYLYDIFQNNYYKSLKDYIIDDFKIYKNNDININDRDNIMLTFIKSYNNISIEIFNGSYNENKLKIDELELKGIYYIKTINMNKREYENFLFYINKDINYVNRIEKIDLLGINNNIEITFVFFRSPPKNYYNTIELAEIILNNNTLHLLKHQDCRLLSLPFMGNSILFINTLKNWINQNLSLLEQERLILFGDIVLNAYGVKQINRIEGVFISIGNDSSEYEKNLEYFINQTLFNNETCFHFTRITKENTKEYNKYHKDIIEKMKKKAGVETTKDLISNPNNFFYYNGLKIISIDLNIIYMNSQSDIELKTDVVMTNIINRNILSRLISYDKNKRIIKTNKKFKLTDNDIKKIKTHAKNNYIKKYINEL